MFYSKFTIACYRSFKDEQELTFAIPKEGKPGSGITYVVGANNVGKTTIAEGLYLHEGDMVRGSEIQQDRSPVFSLYGSENELVSRVELIRDNANQLKEDPKGKEVEFVRCRREWDSGIQQQQNMFSLDQLKRQVTRENPRTPDGNRVDVSDHLKSIEKDVEHYEKFVNVVQRVIPEFSSFSVGYEDREYVKYTTTDGSIHSSDFLGAGVISVLRILLQLVFGEGQSEGRQLLVIDEPELSLQPEAQTRLAKVIAEFAQKRQIMLLTHSPRLVSWEYLKNGAVLNRVTKYNDQRSEIHTMGSYEKYSDLIGGANWQQPFLMDVVAREIFFHDNVLFVEGQEDVGLLRGYDRDLDDVINFFGYGVRGKDNFESALHLARDIGIKKAAVLLDGGKGMDETKENLEKEFSAYGIIKLDMDDIRDKEVFREKDGECVRGEVLGYFDKKGKIREEQKDSFNKKIGEINAYFRK